MQQEKKGLEESILRRLQKKWSPIIFKRDGFKCVVCGNSDRKNLDLAHVTPYSDFKTQGIDNWGLSVKESISLSYSDDNLVTLCSDCHYGYHSNCQEKAKKVQDYFNDIYEKRGWVKAKKKLARLGLEPKKKAMQSRFEVIQESQIIPKPQTPELVEYIHPWCGQKFMVEKQYADNEYEYAYWCEDCADVFTCEYLKNNNFNLTKPIKPLKKDNFSNS
jgi:5-methylcytosine-specific restriction endonuclease McrA